MREKGYNANGAGMPLAQAVKRWPTPKASFTGPDTKRRNRPGSGGDDLFSAVANSDGNGRLNPAWVEWLMGFPIGWTVLPALGDSLVPQIAQALGEAVVDADRQAAYPGEHESRGDGHDQRQAAG